MKLLLDQDVYNVTKRFIDSLGHDVITAGQLGLSQATDEELSNSFVVVDNHGHRIRKILKR